MKEDEFKSKLGAQIKQLRMGSGLSQVELAYRCDMEKQNMYRLESGSENPTILTLKKVAEALNVSLIRLLDFE
ncbi:helix-turn-helix transcriptional regulator [Nostoc sp. NIES-2111]